MACSKAPAKKQPKRGVDFEKIKRKIGRKLPPGQNATNTEIKAKDALLGIKDLFLKHPEELRLHKYAVIEKLPKHIGDDDRAV
ncbi:hypothetical protein M0R45_027286 [Rubus argutus]|uniref:Uncharacterized protein n=1 Tax=Rubus argutus TaxID=59490 RepID=A0AAW1X1P7_RUBAR